MFVSVKQRRRSFIELIVHVRRVLAHRFHYAVSVNYAESWLIRNFGCITMTKAIYDMIFNLSINVRFLSVIIDCYEDFLD